ncbi:hypothetical protein ANCCAN_23466 [Ancylostoma caninum]|uniref:MEIS N-terminal domain-containing protein n=1 Tax=Ancylostoma caninum TaxID=29170 RepID=A0A368FEZ0_ANCCA|nr:hypothetical protein ANCCAN_23466 [Ancylostoma caninum]
MGYPLPSQPGHPLAMGGTSPTAAGTSQTLPMQAVSSPSSSTCIRNDVTPQSGDTSMQQGANNGNPPSLDSISEADQLDSLAAFAQIFPFLSQRKKSLNDPPNKKAIFQGPSMGYPLPSQPGHPLAMGGTSPTAAGTSQTLPMQAVSSPSSSTCIRNDVTPQSGDTSMQQGANNGNPPSLDSISEAELCMSTAAGSRGGGLMDECLQHHQPGLLMDCTGYAGPSGQHRGGYEMYGDGSEFCQQVVVYPQHPSDPPQAGRDTPLRGGKATAAQAKKRGIFPKPATNILRAWLFQHLTSQFVPDRFLSWLLLPHLEHMQSGSVRDVMRRSRECPERRPERIYKRPQTQSPESFLERGDHKVSRLAIPKSDGSAEKGIYSQDNVVPEYPAI